MEKKLARPIGKCMKQTLDSSTVDEIRWCDTEVCLADVFTKPRAKLSSTLPEVLRTGEMEDLKYSKIGS